MFIKIITELSGIYRAFIGSGILTKTESLLLNLERFRLHAKEFDSISWREFEKIDRSSNVDVGKKFKAWKKKISDSISSILK